METDFFAYSRQKIEKDKEEGHFEAAHNREMALRCFVNFLGKEELSLNELTPELMVKFEEWLNTKGRKQSTTRLCLYQISSVYNIAVKEGIVPKLKLLKGVRVALPAKKERELLSVDELRRMRYADLSDSIPQTFARDMFFFCIYGRGISFTDLANIKKTELNNFSKSGRELPFLFANTPGITAWSENGVGTGTTYMRIRGAAGNRRPLPL